jgi:uncharacterized damage-inducible protein DinB
MNSQNELFVSMVLSAWHAQNKRLDDLIGKLTDEQWMKETAPGRNTGNYLLGHLTAVNDGMLALLGFGEKTHPELEAIFLASADKSGQAMPSLSDLKKYWSEINAKLAAHMQKMQADEWFTKHSSVSAEDFAKEPNRNKLNIIITRTNHQSYHLGQLAYIK